MDPFPPTAAQKAVIEHHGSNLLVFAGPGTGKTETLARRFAWLVGQGVVPSRILVLTFSRRAADEMRDRILLRLRQLRNAPLAISELFVKTFHGFCGRLLDGDDARLQRDNLLTPVKERLMWHAIIHAGTLKLASFDQTALQSGQFATDCLNIIAHLKGQGISAERLAALAADDLRLHDIAQIFDAMETRRRALGLRDFRDMVNEAVSALQDEHGTAAIWLRAQCFAHVLVDEFQDSDLMQLELLDVMRRALDPVPEFCFVGDVNQSIYRFRGASPANIAAARQSFHCETLDLRDNRRSAQAILDVANIDGVLDPASLTVAADENMAGDIHLLRPRSIAEEVHAICQAIVREVNAGTSPRAVAVLLRQTRPYQELVMDGLSDVGVPVAALPAAGFHEDALVDAVLSALRLLASPDDKRLWQRVLCNPIVGFHPIGVRWAFDAGRLARMHDPRAMLRTYPPHGFRPIKDVLRAWETCVEMYGSAKPLELVETIARELDLLRPIRDNMAVQGFDRIASPLRLEAVLDAARDYADEGLFAFISRLDETIALLADASQPPASTIEGVRVMSIHAAKGLEFDFVVIPQMIDGILPASERPNRLLSPRTIKRLADAHISVALSDDDALVEEHSLWYVALTRAKRRVLATAARVDDEGVELQLSPLAESVPQIDAVALPGEPRSVEARGVAQPSQMTPIRLPIARLSPTGINNFVTCPRRFFYRDVLRLPSRDDDATQYGKTLHQVLRRFHDIERDFENIGDPGAAIVRYRRTLRELVGEETGTASADANAGPLARFERDDLTLRLDRYAVRLAEEASREPFRVLACESPIVSRFESVEVHGRVDRVDRRAQGGGLIVRDYKSGRSKTPLVTVLRTMFEQIDAGASIFGDAPSGLNLQTLLYMPGVEELFGEPVRWLDYLYFRGKDLDDDDLRIDRTVIAKNDSNDPTELGPAEVARVERDIAARIVELCSKGGLTAFPTTHDPSACTYCSFARICPGPGAVA